MSFGHKDPQEGKNPPEHCGGTYNEVGRRCSGNTLFSRLDRQVALHVLYSCDTRPPPCVLHYVPEFADAVVTVEVLVRQPERGEFALAETSDRGVVVRGSAARKVHELDAERDRPRARGA